MAYNTWGISFGSSWALSWTRSESVPTRDTHDGASPEDLRRWKKYLKELKEYQENKNKPLLKKKRRKKSVLPSIEFNPDNFPTKITLEREIMAVMALIAQREEYLKALDDEEAMLLLL